MFDSKAAHEPQDLLCCIFSSLANSVSPNLIHTNPCSSLVPSCEMCFS
eukprot:UN22684